MLTNLHPYRALLAMGLATVAAISMTLSHSTISRFGAVFLLLQLSMLTLPRLVLKRAMVRLRVRP
jgi:hypothetical protein